MKYLGLLWNNVFRNRRRTFLTITSIAVSLFLIATLLTMLSEMENPPSTPQSALRLIARHRVSLANILPMSYRLKIARVDGVDAVIGSMWFGGVYKDPKNFFAQFAVDADQFFQIYGDVVLPEDQKAAFVSDRTGALVGENLAQRFGWKVGDRVTLQGALFDFSPELTIRGIYSGGGDDGSTFYFHWDYFNEGMKKLFGTNSEAVNFTGFFTIRAKSADLVPSVAEKVDELFKNSSSPTKTESEKAFVLGFLAMMGNVRLLVTSICSVMMFTIVLVAANTMAMSIRERVREIGIMKALGFRKSHILSLLLGESMFLALGGAILGSVLAKLVFAKARLAAATGGMIQQLRVSPGTLLLCATIGLLVGVVSAGIPSWQAARRRVVDALRDVD
jgi:putative ABC transport system permease protein